MSRITSFDSSRAKLWAGWCWVLPVPGDALDPPVRQEGNGAGSRTASAAIARRGTTGTTENAGSGRPGGAWDAGAGAGVPGDMGLGRDQGMHGTATWGCSLSLARRTTRAWSLMRRRAPSGKSKREAGTRREAWQTRPERGPAGALAGERLLLACSGGRGEPRIVLRQEPQQQDGIESVYRKYGGEETQVTIKTTRSDTLNLPATAPTLRPDVRRQLDQLVSQTMAYIAIVNHTSTVSAGADAPRVRLLVILDKLSGLHANACEIDHKLHAIIASCKHSVIQSIQEDAATNIYFPAVVKVQPVRMPSPPGSGPPR
ncbi:hypothetical protein JB92DRAFT_3092649 [Gautieria morchelliformis]|nr:hypothetical protein JB92DRAFT_3092649 [Gautieria morchelliformis]